MPPRKPKKFTFQLKHVDTNKVDVKYELALISNIGDYIAGSKCVTRITDLSTQKENQESCTYSFLDESKQQHNCIISMYDFLQESCLPVKTDISCFWCKHAFTTTPIGCPIRYIPAKVTKAYYSEITKDTYQITDNLTPLRKKGIPALMEKHDSKFEIHDNNDEYFLTDGVFCSFNCCISFINEMKSYNSLYEQSKGLLLSLYSSLFETDEPIIHPAPHWRLLKSYGGYLTIEEFRNSFDKVEYQDIKDYVHKMPCCFPIGFLYEKKVKF